MNTTAWYVDRHPLYGGWVCVRLVEGCLEIWPQRWMTLHRAEAKATELNGADERPGEQEGSR